MLLENFFQRGSAFFLRSLRMPGVSIVGGKQRVVDAGTLTIDEYAGNVATKEDRLSIAYATALAR